MLTTPTNQLPATLFGQDQATPTAILSEATPMATPTSVELCEKVCGVFLLWAMFYIQPIKPKITVCQSVGGELGGN